MNTDGIQFFSRTRLCVMTPLAAIGLALSGFLLWQSQFASGIAGCGGSQYFDCEHVLNSPWSKILGIPVSALAVAVYATMLALVVTHTSTKSDMIRRWSAYLVYSLAISAGLAAIWFTGLQALVLRHFCPYCLGAHFCGLSLAALVLSAPLSVQTTQRFALIGSSFAGIAFLTFAQIWIPAQPFTIVPITDDQPTDSILISPFDDDIMLPPQESDKDRVTVSATTTHDGKTATTRSSAPAATAEHKTSANHIRNFSLLVFSIHPSFLLTGIQAPANKVEDPKQQGQPETKTEAKRVGRTISILNESTKLNSWEWPIVGKPDAKYILVELFDYTCPHCRETNNSLKEVTQRYGDELGILMLPIPMNSRCNDTIKNNHPAAAEACELSKISIAVWLASPASFPEFHHWMMADANAPDAKSARAKAIELVGAETLDQQLASGRPEKWQKASLSVYKKLGAQQIPKIAFPKTVVVGSIGSADLLQDLISKNFGK